MKSWLLCLLLVPMLAIGCAKKEAAPDGGASGATTSGGAPAGGTVPADLDQGPRAGDSPADHERAEEGETLFKDKGCSACHAFGKRVTGPDLAGVTKRRTAQWIQWQILHPDKMVKEDPISRGLFAQFALQMPNQGLTEPQAKAVIEYFKQQDRGGESGH